MNGATLPYIDVYKRFSIIMFDVFTCSDLEAALRQGKWVVAPSAEEETVQVVVIEYCYGLMRPLGEHIRRKVETAAHPQLQRNFSSMRATEMSVIKWGNCSTIAKLPRGKQGNAIHNQL